MSWIYIIGVIIFAIVSNVNKAQKGKGKQKPAPGSMPTFGGGGARKQKEQRSGFPTRGKLYPQTAKETMSSSEERQYDESTSSPDSRHYPVPDSETGEGVSLEHLDEEQVGDRAERMNMELEQMYSTFERISAEDSSNKRSTASTVHSKDTSSDHNTGVGVHPKQLQNGLIWAEILSPPHSKRTYNSRRRF